MSSFYKEVPHQLGRGEAKQRLQTFLEKVTQQFQEQVTKLNGEWDDNVLRFAFTTYGFNITGTLTVEDHLARVEGKLPLAALLFKGAIEQSIGDELNRELA